MKDRITKDEYELNRKYYNDLIREACGEIPEHMCVLLAYYMLVRRPNKEIPIANIATKWRSHNE